MTDTLQYEHLEDKKVIVHVIKEDNTLDELEGLLVAATADGVLVHIGKVNRFIKPEQLEEVQLAPEKPKKLKSKMLKPVTSEEIRQHLADRHGVKLEKLQAGDTQGMVEWHETVHKDELGHKHGIKGADEVSEPEAVPA